MNGDTVSNSSGSGTFGGTARASNGGTDYEVKAPATTVADGVTTTTSSASASTGGTQGENKLTGTGRTQTQAGGQSETGSFHSDDNGQTGGRGNSVTVVKKVAGDTTTIVTTNVGGEDKAKSNGHADGTSETRSSPLPPGEGQGEGALFDVTGHDKSEGGTGAGVRRVTVTRAPDASSREVVTTTAADTGDLTTDGHAKQDSGQAGSNGAPATPGSVSRDGDYTLNQGNTNNVALDSVSNSQDADGTLRFATVNGTLFNLGHLGGNGDYVTAAQSGSGATGSASASGTTQTGRVDTTGRAKLDLNGTEGSFKLTPIMDGENQIGQEWSGSLITVTDTGNSTVANGGDIKIDAAGNVTATNLSNSDLGNGTRTVVFVNYSGKNEEPAEGQRHIERHNRTDTYITTTKNEPAQGPDKPATKGSTDTHVWDESKLDRTKYVEYESVPGNETTPAEEHYHEWNNWTAKQSSGVDTTTVTLVGTHASASITSNSSYREESTAPWDSYRGNIWRDRVDALPEDPAEFSWGNGTKYTIRGGESRSTYSSEHEVDAQGRAHGGTFSATSHSRDWAGIETISDWGGFGDDFLPDAYTYPDATFSLHILETTGVQDDAIESGWYEDLVIPILNVAIRIQGGSYEHAVVNRQEKSSDQTADTKVDHSYSELGPAKHEVTHFQSRETDTTATTTEGSYGPFGGSEKTAVTRDFDERSREDYDTDYRDSDVHFYTRVRDSLEIHVTPSSVAGHGRHFVDALVTPDPGVPYHIDDDIDPFEGQTPPTPPLNPPATLAERGEPGGPGQEISPEDQTTLGMAQRLVGSETLVLTPSDDSPALEPETLADRFGRYRWNPLNVWRRWRIRQEDAAAGFRNGAEEIAERFENATVTGRKGPEGMADAVVGGIGSHAMRLVGHGFADLVDLPGTVEEKYKEDKAIYDRHGAAVVVGHEVGVRQGVEIFYDIDIMTLENVDKMQKAAEMSGKIGGTAGAAAGFYAFGKPKRAPTEHHLMTNKNRISQAAGGPFTPKFEELAKRRGITLEDAINKVRLRGHQGPHPEYNAAVYDQLFNATKGLRGKKFNEAFDRALEAVRRDTLTPGTLLNNLATGQGGST